MNSLITVKPEKCVGCNACVRTCPAPEANITRQLNDGRFVTTVNDRYCIACGECVRNCSHGARDYNDDTEEALEMMKTQRMVVIAAPAIKTVYPNTWKNILTWFRNKGCLVYDVSFGADICTWAHLRAIQNKQVRNLITQPCAAIVKYIETYQPSLIENLSPIHSPMLCAVTYIRKYLHKTEPIIALSPCVAKKNEFTETKLVEFNVTFRKMSEYFEKRDIKIATDSSLDFKFDFDGEQGQVGAVYPRAGGLRDNLWLHDPELNITTSEGVHKVYPELDMYAGLPEFMKPEVFDVLSCEFGCNVGAGTGSNKTIFDVMKTMRDVEHEAKSRRKTSGGFFRGADDKLFKRFDEELHLSDFIRGYLPSVRNRTPTSEELEPVWKSMGKHTLEERNYNCHACGYKGCAEMAVAIYRGLNSANNCIVHAKNVLLAHHSELTKKHEQLSEITDKCKELSIAMQHGMEHITNDVSSIRSANKDLTNQANSVQELLSHVVDYCESNNESMDSESVRQLIAILQTTLESFNSLYKSASESVEGTKSVDDSISAINGLVENICNTLNEIE